MSLIVSLHPQSDYPLRDKGGEESALLRVPQPHQKPELGFIMSFRGWH